MLRWFGDHFWASAYAFLFGGVAIALGIEADGILGVGLIVLGILGVSPMLIGAFTDA